MMNSLLTYIKSWFPEHISSSRKRKLSSSLSTRSPKYPKLLSAMADSMLEDEPFHTPLRCSSRTSPQNGLKSSDDDSFGGRLRSSRPSSDESIYHKDSWSPGPGYTHISRFHTSQESLATPNGSSPAATFQNSLTRSRAKSRQALDYSVQLDAKRKYDELLSKISPKYGASPPYRSPPRCPLAQTQRPLAVVDLTDELPKQRLSTRDRMLSIVEKMEENEVPTAVIEDSDSEVEILPTPPSPKPDIKVDRVNSLKKFVNSSQVASPKWLEENSRNHKRLVDDRARQIQLYDEQSTQLNEINRDLLIQRLTRKVKHSLSIQSVLLPEIELEDEVVEFPELTSDHLKIIKAASTGRKDEVLTKKFNLNLSRQDIQTLFGLNWLNDNVVNFYMNLIMQRSDSDRTKYPRTYAFNTFFYERLMKSGPESLRRWTRRVDIFENDFILVPIHLGMHWCMAVVFVKENAIRYYDSMGHSNDGCLRALKEYLEYEHQDKKQTPLQSIFTVENCKEIPQQMNGSDCGMFACSFAEYTARRAKFTFSQEHMPYLRKKMLVEILTGELLIT